MRKVFVRWAVVAAAMLVGSTVCGVVVTNIMPKESPETHRVGPPARPAAIRYDLLNRPATQFDPPEQPGNHETVELTAPLLRITTPAEAAVDDRWMDQFDTARMAEEEVALGYYKLQGTQPTQADIDRAAAGIHTDLSDLRANRPTLFPAGTVTLLWMRWSATRQEVQVVAKHAAAADGRTTVRFTRWWLARDAAGAWRVYDFDFPDTHLRFLAVRSFLLDRPQVIDRPGAADGPEGTDLVAFRTYLQGVYWMSLAAAANDPAAVNAKVVHMTPAAADPVPAVAAARHALLQRIAGLHGDQRGADMYFTRSALEWPDTPSNVLAAATAANARKNFRTALERVAEYRDAVGDNPEAYREEAKARAGLANDPKAATAVLRKGLLVFPGDRALLLDLARRVPADEREAVGELVATTATADVIAVAAGLVGEQFPSIVDGLATGFLRVKPQDRGVQVRSVHAKMALGRTAAAAGQLKAARAADPGGWPAVRAAVLADPKASRAATDFYDLFAQAGDGEAAYRQLARRYEGVAGQPNPGVREAAVKALDALNAAHAAKHPADPELALWQAHALHARGEYAKAEEKLAAAMAKLPRPTSDARTAYNPDAPPAAREAFVWGWNAHRRLRTVALAKLGKWKQAYESLPPAGDTFDQLADLFVVEQDEFALAELVALHAAKHPADAELGYWRGQVHFLKRDYEAALREFLAFQTRKADGHGPPDFPTHERLIRTYLRLNRPADAKSQLDWYEQSTDGAGRNPFHRALVAVAADDPDGVLDALDALDADPQAAFPLYADPDAAALRTKPVFAAVRQKYPPPVR